MVHSQLLKNEKIKIKILLLQVHVRSFGRVSELRACYNKYRNIEKQKHGLSAIFVLFVVFKLYYKELYDTLDKYLFLLTVPRSKYTKLTRNIRHDKQYTRSNNRCLQ